MAIYENALKDWEEQFEDELYIWEHEYDGGLYQVHDYEGVEYLRDFFKMNGWKEVYIDGEGRSTWWCEGIPANLGLDYLYE